MGEGLEKEPLPGERRREWYRQVGRARRRAGGALGSDKAGPTQKKWGS